MSDSIPEFNPAPKGRSVQIPLLIGLVIALVAANGYLFFRMDGLKADISKVQRGLLTEISQLRDAASVTTEASRQRLETLRSELDATRQQAKAAVGQARKDAQKHADLLARKLQEEQVRQDQQVRSELSEVKKATDTANTKISDVSTEVGTVKTDVAATKSELSQTISELKSVRGDLGVQSGLIATNSKELSALKALGERNYFEFTLNKTKQFQKIADVAFLLKKSDPKRNRYTLEVLADDKRVEKKDKTSNEPVQFYTGKARQPYEIVVNEVKKDRIVGYLATPKVQMARNQ